MRRSTLPTLLAAGLLACSTGDGGGADSPGGDGGAEDTPAAGDRADDVEDASDDPGAPAEDATHGDDAFVESDASEGGFDSSDPEDAGHPSDAGDDMAAPPSDAGEPVEDAGPVEDPIPEPDVQPSYGNCSEPGGDRNIYDLRDPQCPDHISPAPTGTAGVDVVLDGVIVTAVYGDLVFVQEPNGGPYSGIAIFPHGIYTGDRQPGDVLTVTGSYSEFYDASQIYLVDWEETGTVAPPEPFDVAHPSHVATNGPLAEMFESVLVRVHDVETIHTKPDCPHEFGEFLVTGDLRVDDLGYAWDARLGDVFASITGPLHYAFGNFKLEPRGEQDVIVLETGSSTGISKCIEAECIELPTAPVTRQIVINEVMVDPYGDDSVQEWIELHNPTEDEVALDGWTIRDCASQEAPIISAGLVIGAGGYVVLGAKLDPVLNGDVPVDYAYGSAFYLPNTLGAVLLYDAQDGLVDQMRYSTHEPFEALELGSSMERVGPDTDGTQPQSWVEAEQPWGATENRGTPGAPNAAQGTQNSP